MRRTLAQTISERVFITLAVMLKKWLFLRLLKNAQMQVELCEIPPAGAPASLSPAGQAGNPESGVATNKERHLATPTSW
jgi:hypothetical protein